MSGRILIYDNATGDGGFEHKGNYANLNGTPASASPTAADIVLYGSTNYTVNSYDESGGQPTAGAAVFAPGANVNFVGLPGYSGYTFGSLLEPAGSYVTVTDTPMSAGKVLLGPGSTLTLGDEPFGGVDAIGNLWNEGGTLVNLGNLRLGGPGFIQTGGFTTSETEIHAGINQWINLGNVAQGSHPAALDFDLLNSTNHAQSGFLFAQGDGGFTPNIPQTVNLGPAGVYNPTQEHTAGSLAVNTGTLGGHWEQLSYVGSGGVMATTGIWDNVVKA
jgi:hypothetical protein